MICDDLISNKRIAKANFSWYPDSLHPDVRQLISSWFNRAWGLRDCIPEDSFEPFIFSWIAFNAWGSCITGLDKERRGGWLDALMLNETIYRDFAQLAANNQSSVAIHGHKFHQLWPIFKAQSIRKAGLRYRGRIDDRRLVVEYYLKKGITKFEPQCWTRHRDAGEDVPLDWPHTLAALYRVRCNLFHGEKTADSENDQRIVFHALQVLIHFLHEKRYLY